LQEQEKAVEEEHDLREKGEDRSCHQKPETRSFRHDLALIGVNIGKKKSRRRLESEEGGKRGV